MLYREICKVLGLYLYGFAATLLFPLGVAVYYRFFGLEFHPQQHTFDTFLLTIILSLLLASLLFWIGRNTAGRLYRKEALLSVVIIWFLTPALAALPFYLSGTLTNPFQAYFEAASGLTTTGSTVMCPKKFDSTGKEIPFVTETNGPQPTKYVFYGTIDPVIDPSTGAVLFTGIEAVSKALLFWRSFIQWLGGIGIIVLFVAILPPLGIGGKVLFFMETPGPIKDALTPRIRETATLLWKIYLFMTAAQVVLLMYTNAKMDLFNAVCTSFTTLSTGGFSVRNDSIGAYQNAATDWIIIIFMVLGSINFGIYYSILKGKFYRAYEPEFFLFLAILFFSGLFTTWALVGSPMELLGGPTNKAFTWPDALRYGFFQTTSANTSTGFSVANYDLWPSPVQVLILILMFVGGMAGSTAGGIKVIRQFILFRIVQNRVESLIRPETVQQFRIGNREVGSGTTMMVTSFFTAVIAFSVLAAFLYVLDHIDVETSIGLVACMINNTGLSFRIAGPIGSCAFLSNFGCVLSSLLMILGRLEFFAVLSILVPAFWRQT
jgi:trk/ktr system potassium uptake protein